MQISSDVHNYMETLVGQVLSSDQYTSQFDNEQLADIACLALIQLKPVYIRHDIDFSFCTTGKKTHSVQAKRGCRGTQCCRYDFRRQA